MKKVVVWLLALSLLLTGCSFGVSQADLDALREDLEEEREKIEMLEERLEALEQGRPSEHEQTQAPTEHPTEAVPEAPTEAAPEAPAEAPGYIPDATVLIDENWESGSLLIIALDETTLRVQLTDDRPDQEYEDLGTLWELRFEYGRPVHSEYNGYQVLSGPYLILLSSAAYSGSGLAEFQQGTLADYYERKDFKTLWLAETIMFEEETYTYDPSVYVDLEIEREGDTYTAIISLPEWFEASAADDLEVVDVSLYKPDFWKDMAEDGSAIIETYFTFEP